MGLVSNKWMIGFGLEAKIRPETSWSQNRVVWFWPCMLVSKELYFGLWPIPAVIINFVIIACFVSLWSCCHIFLQVWKVSVGSRGRPGTQQPLYQTSFHVRLVTSRRVAKRLFFYHLQNLQLNRHQCRLPTMNGYARWPSHFIDRSMFWSQWFREVDFLQSI